jgi:hypothetical protein
VAYDLSSYEPVEERLARFWGEHPAGSVITELVAYSDQQYIVHARVYRDQADPQPAGTGFAEERVGSSPVNRTSALENCETSAVGRALANAGYAPKGARPSREEMTKAAAHRDLAADTQAVSRPVTRDKARRNAPPLSGPVTEKQLGLLGVMFGKAGIDDRDARLAFVQETVFRPITTSKDLTVSEASQVIDRLKLEVPPDE